MLPELELDPSAPRLLCSVTKSHENSVMTLYLPRKRESLKDMLHRDGIAIELNEDIDMVLTGSCGATLEYKTLNDIPLEDVPCPCGEKGKYMIKWEPCLPHGWKTSNFPPDSNGVDVRSELEAVRIKRWG